MTIKANSRARNHEGKFVTVHGMSKSPTHSIWMDMIKRCKEHPRYAGRGIKVCKRWMKFENFLADMGKRPPRLSLDRYPNNDGNYEPGNCRWATAKQQANNTRGNRHLTVGERTQTIAQWADETGVPAPVIQNRLVAGWPDDMAIHAEVGSRFKPRRDSRPEVAGERSGSAKLTADKVISIRHDTRTNRALAAIFGVAHTTIGAIKRREKWTHI